MHLTQGHFTLFLSSVQTFGLGFIFYTSIFFGSLSDQFCLWCKIAQKVFDTCVLFRFLQEVGSTQWQHVDPVALIFQAVKHSIRHRLLAVITLTFYLLTGCLTGLLQVTPSACSDDSHALYSSKMILHEEQVENSWTKDHVNLTDSILLLGISKRITTKCSSVEKIWSFVYKMHQFTPVKNMCDLRSTDGRFRYIN